MKFNYEYRTSDNVRHEGTIAAANRDAAFAALRAQGIKPGRMTEAPGLANKLFGKGKRWIAIIALLLVIAAGLCLLNQKDQKIQEQQTVIETTALPFEDMTRRQVIGDLMVIEKGIRDGWSDVFEHEGERFLAGFAVPGVPVSVRNTSEDEIKAALARKIEVNANDSLEARQIKAMVEGMKDELRTFIAKGGVIVAYGRKLVQRQEQEIAYYNRAKNEIEQLKKSNAPEQEIVALWEERNTKLRKMGIKLVALPE